MAAGSATMDHKGANMLPRGHVAMHVMLRAFGTLLREDAFGEVTG